jgi:hypothetical protein
MADEDVVLDDDAFTDKTVTGDLAPFANAGILLNFNERPDFCFVTDLASVEIDELGKLYVFAQLHVGANGYMFIHRVVLDFSESTGNAAWASSDGRRRNLKRTEQAAEKG